MDKEELFESLIKENHARLVRICRTYADNEHPQEDIYQEIMVQLWRSLSSFKGNAEINTWLYRVALNTAISLLRKKNKYRSNHIELSELKENVLLSVSDKPVDSEELKLLYDWIGKLNTIDKTIMMLYLEDVSYKQMAEITGLTESNIGARLNRIKQRLKLKAQKYE